MRFHTFSRPLAVALLLALTPALAPAQSASFNFAADHHLVTSVDWPAGNGAAAWSHGTTPGPGGATAWSILNQGQGASSAFGLQSPAAVLEVTMAGQVTGSISHRFSFGVDTEGGEGGAPVFHDGGVIEYRKNGTGGWVTLQSSDLVGTGGTLGYAPTVIVGGTGNPLSTLNGFGGMSPNYGAGEEYDITNFTLGDTAAATFIVGDTIEVRFVAGFAGNEFTSNFDPNWQIGSVSLFDATPVPEPGGVLGGAAVALAAVGLRRRVTSAASRRNPAS